MLKEDELLKGQYRIGKKIGGGGYGLVYLAEDTHFPIPRICVAKELKQKFEHPEQLEFARQRFKREAVILQKLGELAGGRVPKLFAYFCESVQDEESFFLVQEYIEGGTPKVCRDGSRWWRLGETTG